MNKDLKQKNIDFAAGVVAETIFYHFTDSTHKEKLKTALKMFANIILNSNEPGAVSSHEAEKEVCECPIVKEEGKGTNICWKCGRTVQWNT